jgi:hypothetical protein
LAFNHIVMAYLLPIFSFLFRLATYGYLRVIPAHRIAKFAIPVLYAAFLAVALPTVVEPPPTVVVIPKKIEILDVTDVKTEEVVEEIVQVEGTAVVVEAANGHANKSAAPVSIYSVCSLNKAHSAL